MLDIELVLAVYIVINTELTIILYEATTTRDKERVPQKYGPSDQDVVVEMIMKIRRYAPYSQLCKKILPYVTVIV